MLTTLQVQRLGRVDYARALLLQEERVAAKLAGAADDFLVLLEHEPVYTLGRGARESDLLGAPERLGVPVFRVGRGGGVTYHGPGQLVAYPIVTLARQGRDVHRYVRRLEEVLIGVCAAFGIEAFRREGSTGVWSQNGKIASIGVGVRRWVAFHGVALNVNTDLAYFQAIVPCAMPGLVVTSLERELGRRLDMAAVSGVFERQFRQVFGYVAAAARAVA